MDAEVGELGTALRVVLDEDRWKGHSLTKEKRNHLK
jgi:hypothetical protein